MQLSCMQLNGLHCLCIGLASALVCEGGMCQLVKKGCTVSIAILHDHVHKLQTCMQFSFLAVHHPVLLFVLLFHTLPCIIILCITLYYYSMHKNLSVLVLVAVTTEKLGDS